MRQSQTTPPKTLDRVARRAVKLVSAARWLARETISEFTTREPKNRNPAPPGAPPNGSPGTPLGNSGVAEGPPSVSFPVS
jgi:hypothetical protein